LMPALTQNESAQSKSVHTPPIRGTSLAGIFLSNPMRNLGLAPIVSMAIGALLGGASQFLIQVPSAHRIGFCYRPVIDFRDPGVRQIAKLMLPAIVGLSATQVNIAVDTHLASRYGDGPVSYLNYAFRLMQLPIGLFGVAIATSTLAAVSFHAARKHIDKLCDTVSSSLRIAAASFVMGLVALLAFQGGQRLLPARGTFGIALHLGIAIVAGIIAILPLLRLFKVREERELSGLVARLMGGML